MSKIVNGSSLQPLSGGSPKQIVLLLHGFGSNGADRFIRWSRMGVFNRIFAALAAKGGKPAS